MARFNACMDCGRSDPEYYIIRDEIWLSVAQDDEILCLPCVEARLGRSVADDDFVFTPIEMMARLHAPAKGILEAGGVWDAVFGKETDHQRFRELAAGTNSIGEFWDRILADHPAVYEGHEFRSSAEWSRYLDEAYAAQIAEAGGRHLSLHELIAQPGCRSPLRLRRTQPAELIELPKEVPQ